MFTPVHLCALLYQLLVVRGRCLLLLEDVLSLLLLLLLLLEELLLPCRRLLLLEQLLLLKVDSSRLRIHSTITPALLRLAMSTNCCRLRMLNRCTGS